MERDPEKRDGPRYEVLECGMLWRPTGSVPERIGAALITNASVGGVQLRTRAKFDEPEPLLLQLGSCDGPIFIPGDLLYCAEPPDCDGLTTFGFRFRPGNERDREAIATYVFGLKDRVCTSA